MKKKTISIWTWCPQCTVRTDHERIDRYYRCGQCDCLHIGAQIIDKLLGMETSGVIQNRGVYHGI
ncbi:MAG TPA: hypothetical protein VF326_05530 [Anaerolineaceae bacterium]